MSQELSNQETVSTTTSTLVRTPRENTKQDVSSVRTEDTSMMDTNLKTDSSSVEPTPNELVALGRPPLVVELLHARDAYETFDVKETLAQVDEFIRGDIDDSREAYIQAYNGLVMNLKETDDIYTKISQLKDYVNLQKKIRGIIKEKEEFEAKDPNDMSAEELKRLLNARRN